MPTVLITGANRGLGREFARQYAAAGWRVIATARRPAEASTLRAVAPSAEIHALDVADLAAVAAFGRAFAEETVDVLVANAGVSLGRGMRPDAIDLAAWEESFRVNAIAPLALAAAFHAQVARSHERKMIAVTSRLGSMGANGDGARYVYRSSKAALNAVWRSYAIDHPEIIAVLLHPGWVRTDMGGREALLNPEESVAGLRRTIAGLTQAESGRFYNYDGSPIPW